MKFVVEKCNNISVQSFKYTTAGDHTQLPTCTFNVAEPEAGDVTCVSTPCGSASRGSVGVKRNNGSHGGGHESFRVEFTVVSMDAFLT